MKMIRVRLTPKMIEVASLDDAIIRDTFEVELVGLDVIGRRDRLVNLREYFHDRSTPGYAGQPQSWSRWARGAVTRIQAALERRTT